MRYFLSVLAVIILVVVAIIVIAHTGGSHKGIRKVPAINVANYDNATSAATQTNYGLLVGNDQRTAIRIIITASSRQIQILSGYQESVSSSETYNNNPIAYGVFLGALQNANFARSRPTKEGYKFGICPLGDTYTYQFTNNYGANTISNLWATSCSLSDGNFDGQGSLIVQLFQSQIPNYEDYTATLQNISA